MLATRCAVSDEQQHYDSTRESDLNSHMEILMQRPAKTPLNSSQIFSETELVDIERSTIMF
jgi:hypothetical protein